MLKREMDLIRREEKIENVERISRAQAYKKEKILEKIEYGNMKAHHINQEKAKLLETRFNIRKQADRQKKEIINVFETLKKQGKIDN